MNIGKINESVGATYTLIDFGTKSENAKPLSTF